MEGLIDQVTGLLADARAFTPELAERLGPVMTALAQFRIGLFTVLTVAFAALTVSLVVMMVIAIKREWGEYEYGYVGFLIPASVSFITTVSLLPNIFIWQFNLRMIQMDLIAWFAMKGIGL